MLSISAVTNGQFDCSGNRGLLGVAEDPSFATNGYIYVQYTSTVNFVHSRISRFTISGNVAVPGSEMVLYDLDRSDHAVYHYGGPVEFGPDGFLYISTGDNTVNTNSQDMNSLLGKMLRINKDGSVPVSNPFYPSPIWALGLRNPFSMAFNFATGQFFINDVGLNTYEEVDVGAAGRNYGWSICEGPCQPSNPAFTDPLYYYSHINGQCAISGGTFYYPAVANLPSAVVGKYLFNDLCSGKIYYIDPNTPGPSKDTATVLFSGLATPIGLEVDALGNLLYLQNDGAIGLLSGVALSGPSILTQPADVTAAPGTVATFSVKVTPSTMVTYQWQRNGQNIAGATGASFSTAQLTPANSGDYYCCLISIAGGSAVASRGARLTVSQSNASPSVNPVKAPTVKPANKLTSSPFHSTTKSPSHYPTLAPSISPSKKPAPFRAPTLAPTSRKPTPSPTRTLTLPPSRGPSRAPSHPPSRAPSRCPSRLPTVGPTKKH